MMKRTPLLVLALVASASAAASAATARARLRPAQLAVGTPAQLTITVDDDATPPEVRIPDASVRYTGQMQQTTVINGKASNALTFSYSVVPDTTGTLDVPPLSVATAHGTVATAAVQANVANAPAPGAASASPPSAANGAGVGGAGARGNDDAGDARDVRAHAFVRRLDIYE